MEAAVETATSLANGAIERVEFFMKIRVAIHRRRGTKPRAKKRNVYSRRPRRSTPVRVFLVPTLDGAATPPDITAPRRDGVAPRRDHAAPASGTPPVAVDTISGRPNPPMTPQLAKSFMLFSIRFRWFATASATFLLSLCGPLRAEEPATLSRVVPGLEYQDLGKTFDADLNSLVDGLYHHIADDREVCGGNTSLRNESEASLIWKGHPSDNGHGYFQRNRDLGQIVNVPDGPPRSPRGLVLRTAKGNNAMMSGVPGSMLYIQWFSVEPDGSSPITIDDFGTPQGTRAKHGFDHAYHRADDIVRGVRYRPLVRFVGAVVPEDVPTTDRYVYDRGRGQPFGEQPGHLRYFRLTFPADHGFVLFSDLTRRWARSFGPHGGLGFAPGTLTF